MPGARPASVVRDLELAERLVLDRLRVATYDDYRARAAAPRSPTASLDDVVAFARRELESAQHEWREVQALEVPPAGSTVDENGEVHIDLRNPAAPTDVA